MKATAHVSIFQDHSDTTHSFCSAFDATMPPQLHYYTTAAPHSGPDLPKM
jgi:hypothetical protein